MIYGLSNKSYMGILAKIQKTLTRKIQDKRHGHEWVSNVERGKSTKLRSSRKAMVAES